MIMILRYMRDRKTHKNTLKTIRMHMEKLEVRVANECKDAFTALQTHLTEINGSDREVPFRSFPDFMANVLFPGNEMETKDLLARLSAPSSKFPETPQVIISDFTCRLFELILIVLSSTFLFFRLLSSEGCL